MFRLGTSNSRQIRPGLGANGAPVTRLSPAHARSAPNFNSERSGRAERADPEKDMNMARGAIEQADAQFGFQFATGCEPPALCASSRRRA
jgi:hypothetical protein